MALTASRAKIQLSPSQQYEALARDSKLAYISANPSDNSLAGDRYPTYAVHISLFVTTESYLAFDRHDQFQHACSSTMLLRNDVFILPTPDPKPSYRAQVSSLMRQPSTYRALAIGGGTFAAFALFNCLCVSFL
ncbi:13134_t:CDS:2, partial [Acaulospora colombiana]